MKCINCGTDNNFRDRTKNNRRCKRCQHQFVFDPKAGSPFADLFFKKKLETLSAENYNFFTKKQLSYFLENQFKRQPSANPVSWFVQWIVLSSGLGVSLVPFIAVALVVLGYDAAIVWPTYILLTDVKNFSNTTILAVLIWALICSGVTGLISFNQSSSDIEIPKNRRNHARLLQLIGGFDVIVFTALFFSFANLLGGLGFIIFLLGTGMGLFFIYIGWQRWENQHDIANAFPVKSKELETWLNRWSQVNGEPEKLLPSPKEENSTTFVSPEISSYSFDRVIVCDRSAIAQFLLANNFHFEHNCAILSITGYPQSIFRTVLEMLKRNPKLTVYALHDASPRGVGLVNHLRNTPQWFGDRDIEIYDIGLRPSQIFSGRDFFVRNSAESQQQANQISVAVKQTLSPEEIEWLAKGNFVELESLKPRKLLQIIAQTLTLSRTEWTGQAIDGTRDTTTTTEIAIFSSSSFG